MGHRASAKLPRIACVFRFDPYCVDSCVVVEHEEYALPHDTLHTSLAGKVSFVPYPHQEFVPPAPTVPKDAMARVFIGQLPYQVTDMQLGWLCSTFGNGAAVYYPERITKSDASRTTKVPTGCVHAYCRPDDVKDLMEGLHKRLLIDDTGVWCARTPEEQDALTSYCEAMKKDRKKRFQHRPYDTIVAQTATSTYVPPPPTYSAFVDLHPSVVRPTY